MILFFRTPSKSVIAVESNHQLTPDESNKLCWLFGEAVMESEENLKGCFVGPRREMITPWSTNAVDHPKHGARRHKPHRGVLPC